MFEMVELPIGGTGRTGQLCVIPGCPGLVIFTHANGNHRGSQRSAELAWWLRQRELSTLIFDLISPEETEARTDPVDIDWLAERVGDSGASLGRLVLRPHAQARVTTLP